MGVNWFVPAHFPRKWSGLAIFKRPWRTGTACIKCPAFLNCFQSSPGSKWTNPESRGRWQVGEISVDAGEEREGWWDMSLLSQELSGRLERALELSLPGMMVDI